MSNIKDNPPILSGFADVIVDDILAALQKLGTTDVLKRDGFKKNLKTDIAGKIDSEDTAYQRWLTQQSDLISKIQEFEVHALSPHKAAVQEDEAKGLRGVFARFQAFVRSFLDTNKEAPTRQEDPESSIAAHTDDPQHFRPSDLATKRFDDALTRLRRLATKRGARQREKNADDILRTWLLGGEGKSKDDAAKEVGAGALVNQLAKERATFIRRVGVNERWNDEETAASIKTRLEQALLDPSAGT